MPQQKSALDSGLHITDALYLTCPYIFGDYLSPDYINKKPTALKSTETSPLSIILYLDPYISMD